MLKNLKILLIEDNIGDAEMIKRRFSETVEWLRDRGFLSEMNFDTISIEYIKGTVKRIYKNEIHFYYEDSVICDIQSALKSIKPSEKICILTDILLTEDEDKSARVNDFNQIALVKKLCVLFEDMYSMYFITSITSFGSRVWKILGKEHLVRCYVQKDSVDMPSRKGIAVALYWLCNKELISEKLAQRIEKKELEELMHH